MYNGWANYGMAIGTPFTKSPIYNTDGYMRFTDNRVRGFQLGADGRIGTQVDWRALFSYRTSWGTPFLPAPRKRHDTSMMVEASYKLPACPDSAWPGLSPLTQAPCMTTISEPCSKSNTSFLYI